MQIPLGFAQVNMLFTGAAVPRGAQCTFGVDVTAGVQTPTSVANVVGGAWSNNLDGQFSNSLTLGGCLVKFGPNATGPSAIVALGDAGDSTDPAEAPNVAVLIRKLTILGGHKHQGRMFVPGIPDSVTAVGGFINLAQLGFLQSNATAFLNALSLGNCPMVLLHNDGTAPNLVTGLQVQQTLATQRRRLRK